MDFGRKSTYVTTGHNRSQRSKAQNLTFGSSMVSLDLERKGESKYLNFAFLTGMERESSAQGSLQKEFSEELGGLSQSQVFINFSKTKFALVNSQKCDETQTNFMTNKYA